MIDGRIAIPVGQLDVGTVTLSKKHELSIPIVALEDTPENELLEHDPTSLRPGNEQGAPGVSFGWLRLHLQDLLNRPIRILLGALCQQGVAALQDRLDLGA